MWSYLWLVTLGLPALIKSWKLPNVLNLLTAWSTAVLLNLSSLNNGLSEYPSSCNVTNFDLFAIDNPFLPMFSAAELATILIIFSFQYSQIVKKLILKGFNKSLSYVTILSSMQLQKVSVTLWLRWLHALYYVLSCLFLSTCVLQSVCSYYGLRVWS